MEFHFDNRIVQVLGRAAALVKLNILWIVFSLPLVTGGAALCALHITAVKILKNEEGYVFREFWSVYKGKMKVSLKLWVPLLFAAFLILFDYMFWRDMDGDFAAMMRIFICVAMGGWFALVSYIFPLAARMDVGAGETYRNGLLLMFKYLPQTLYLLFTTALFLAAGLLFTPVFGIALLAGGALLAAAHGKLLLWVFEKEGIVE